MSEVKTLGGLINNLSPYFLSLTIDQENAFTPFVSILIPIGWKVFKNVDYISESFEYSSGANRYHFYLKDTDGDFDEMVTYIQSIIDWNHDYEEKMKVLEQKKQEFLAEQELKLKEMEAEILPKPLDSMNPTSSPKPNAREVAEKQWPKQEATVDDFRYADEVEDDLEPVIKEDIALPSNSPLIVYEDNDEMEPEYANDGLPVLVNAPVVNGDVIGEDPEDDERMDAIVNSIAKTSKQKKK